MHKYLEPHIFVLDMELNSDNVQALSNYLQQTLSYDATARRTAEKYLESIESNKNYALLLLMLVNNSATPMHIRTSAAITFKNFVKRNWRVVRIRNTIEWCSQNSNLAILYI